MYPSVERKWLPVNSMWNVIKWNAMAHIQWLTWKKAVYSAYPIMLWTLMLLKKEYDGILGHTDTWLVEKYEVKKINFRSSLTCKNLLLSRDLWIHGNVSIIPGFSLLLITKVQILWFHEVKHCNGKINFIHFYF